MIKKVIGLSIVGTVLLSTLLAILGVWGVVSGDLVWQSLATLVVLSIGLGTTGMVSDFYLFKDKNNE